MYPKDKLLDKGYSIMSLEAAKSKIANRGIFTDLETVITVNDMLVEKGWQQHGRTLIGILTTILDDEFQGVDVQVVKDSILWKHGSKKVPK